MSDQQTGTVRGETSREIGGRVYTTQPLDARTALEIIRKLMAAAGPDICTMFFALPKDKRKAAFSNPGIIGASFATICMNSPDLGFVPTLLTKTKCDRVRIGDTEVAGNVAQHFDEHFKADFPHLMEVVQFVGEVNFQNP